jgi:hypothetical protein
MPGVVGVFTAADLAADNLAPLPCTAVVASVSPMVVPPRPVLATDRVRHLGEAVALIIATSVGAARDAAEAIEVLYDPLPAVIDGARALGTEAPQIWPQAPGNEAFRFLKGDRAATDAAFAQADHIINLDQWSWSNYAGFNIARAWLPESYAQAVIGLPSDMNDPEWGIRSSALTRASIASIMSHPLHAFGNALTLLWQMVQIPVTIERFNGTGGTYEVQRAIPLYIPPFRVLVGGVLIAQLTVLIYHVMRRHTDWQPRTFERVIWITIFCLTALSETGEQARFVASYIPLLFLGWLEIVKIHDWNAYFRIIQNIFGRLFWKKF